MYQVWQQEIVFQSAQPDNILMTGILICVDVQTSPNSEIRLQVNAAPVK